MILGRIYRLIFVSFVLDLICSNRYAPSVTIMRTMAVAVAATDNIRTACRSIPGLTRDQLVLCQRASDVTAAAVAGLELAVRECQHQFRWHRWNCSSLGNGGRQRNPHHSSTFLRKGYREAAFVFAISSAGVTYSISKACSQGRLLSCSCDGKPRYLKDSSRTSGSPNDRKLIGQLKGQIMNESTVAMGEPRRSTARWKWGGCSHNINYGIAFSEMFLDAREKAGDIQSKINLHNNHAGRMVLTKYMLLRCKCHGMSGSCQMKTCWKSAPDFHVVGTVLKQMFRRAVLVDQSNQSKASPLIIPRKRDAAVARVSGSSRVRMGGKKSKVSPLKESVYNGGLASAGEEEMADMAKCGPNDRRRYCDNAREMEMSLFYYQRSPNFCDRDRGAEILGTIGRRCNRTGTSSGSCSTMCCGRGYTLLMEKYTEKCRCKFHWCCQVQCDECLKEDSISVCN